MPDLVGMLGIRLQLLLGQPDVPLPAPYEVVDALVSLQVTNNDRQRDAFQMTFNLGRDSLLEYGLLRSGVLDVPNRVIIMVIFGGLPQVLIDGIITDHQVIPSNEAGRTQLRVTGEDISIKLSFEDQNATYPHQKDSDIVKKILADAGFIPDVKETDDTPSNFHFNALGPSEAEVSIIDPFTKLAIPLQPLSTFLPSLTSNPTKPLRKTFSRDTANLTLAQALLKLFTSSSETTDVIQADGVVDGV